jgi:hypothetical protein
MIRALNRGIPERHDAIADELVDGAAFLRDRGRDFLKVSRDLDQKVVRCQRFGVAGKVLQIGKEHGEESRLYAEGQRDAGLDQLADPSSGTKEENDFSDVRNSESRRFQLCDL